MKIKRIPAGVYAANCFILMDEDTKEAAVIDPGGDSEDLIKAVNEMDAKVKYILLTHGHTDHTGAAVQLQEEYNVPIYISEKDYRMMENGEYIYGDVIGKVDKFLNEGDTFKIGSIEIKCIHTPGHTPGGICFMVEDVVFTGDTLFAGSIGRTDLAGGDFDAIISNIKNKLMILPDNITVFPGHGPQSSIGRERVHNPFL
ncbi:MAG: MBL fold metallo-hydrolase [Clostridiaceae bacterium]|nr:MBL fold metallo-hydrolase [Clostridiaceae bacterium]